MEPIKIQKIIDYIEAHLTEELSYKQFAAMVAVSEADLQRSFKMITGVTISDYIRYRRLSCAAVDLKNNHKVLDAATKQRKASPRRSSNITGVRPWKQRMSIRQFVILIPLLLSWPSEVGM